MTSVVRKRLKELVSSCKSKFNNRLFLSEHLGKQLVIEAVYYCKTTTILQKRSGYCVKDIKCSFEDEVFFVDHIVTTHKDISSLEENTSFKAYAKVFKYKDKNKYGIIIEDLIEII